MIYIVDGTGEYSDSEYAVSMAGSHCNTIYYLNKVNASYWRGPDMGDLVKRTYGIAREVHDQALRNEFPSALLAPSVRQEPKSSIVLVGYSRGAAAVVMVAKMLSERGIPVSAMFLFDAVSRTTSGVDVDIVPGNVNLCFHAVRNEGAEIVMQAEERKLWKACEMTNGFKDVASEYARVGSGVFEDFLVRRSVHLASRFPQLRQAVLAWHKKYALLQNLKVAMRNSFTLGSGGPSIPFGNCARKADPHCSYVEQQFAGTHAALGGVPWTTLGDEIESMDREVSRRVWTWMSAHMLRCGLRAGKQ